MTNTDSLKLTIVNFTFSGMVSLGANKATKGEMRMRKSRCAGLVMGFFIFGMAAMANASILVEDFEADFPAWESGWLGTSSNIQNYYGVGAGRGNNPDGLWIHDGNSSDNNNAYIAFDSTFGLSITSFSIDIGSFIPDAVISIYDKDGAMIYSSLTAQNYGSYSDPGVYQNHSVTSLNGISGFHITGSYVEGNVGIDNIVVNAGGAPVPEPATMLLFGTGVAGLITRLRKKKNA